MGDFQELMAGAECDKLRSQVVKAAKEWVIATKRHEENECLSDDFILYSECLKSEEKLTKAVKDLEKAEEGYNKIKKENK